MKDILKEIFNVFKSIISSLFDALGITFGQVLCVLFVVCVVVCATPFVVQKLVVFIDAKRRKIPRELQKKVTNVLSTDLCNFYCPRNEYVRVRPESERERRKPLYHSWLSPYRRAVKVQIKKYGKGSQKELFYPRQLVRQAARFIEIRELTDEEKIQYNPPKDAPLSVYVLTLDHNGKSAGDIQRFVPVLKSALNLHSIFPIDNGSSIRSSFVCCETKIEDALVSIKRGVEFLEEHPAENVMKFPVGYRANGDPVMFSVHQSACIGATGSGKSGFFLTTIFQLKDYITGSNGKKKLVRLYGIDPKNSDLGVFKHSSLFERVESDFEGYISVINEVYSLMKNRNDNKKIDLKAGKTGQSLPITEETPVILLMIDEFFSMKNELDSSREGKAAYRLLQMILAQGRSAGVFVLFASQDASQQAFEGIRFNIVNWVLLRQNSDYFNSLFLGQSAKEAGYDSTAIGISNKANGYKYSGIGFMRGEDGKPLKFRYPAILEGDVAKLVRENPRRTASEGLFGDGWDRDTGPGRLEPSEGLQDPYEEEELSLWGWED